MKKSTVRTVVFLSNYFNHHQRPFCDAMYRILGDGYKFIETETMEVERKNMGWGESDFPEYVIDYEEFLQKRDEYISMIDEADVIIIGSAPDCLIKNRVRQEKLIFRYNERPFKDGKENWKLPIRFFTWRLHHPQKNNIKMLCASAYTSMDYAKLGLYINKCYKWGYFPIVKKYHDIDKLLSEKSPTSILWVARLIDLKHPEMAIEVAKRLKEEGYKFKLTIIGNGIKEQELKEKIVAEKLGDCVYMLGSMKPENVRVYMQKSEVFLFTSDKQEGWGAVLNEAMNSACAVVASHAAGSVPYLIKDRENGLIYKNGDFDDLYNKTKWLLDNELERKYIAKNAYLTMVKDWNAEEAAERFVLLAESMLTGTMNAELFEEGVCSKAQIVKDNWYNANH